MLNFRFIKSQFKIVWIIILLFSIAFTVLVAFALMFPNIGDKAVWKDGTVDTSSGGASWILNHTLFGFNSFIILLVFGIVMSLVLINRDINRGYIVSWLTTPLRRSTVFNSKLFLIITATIFLNFWIVLMEIIFFSIRMGDFSQIVGPLLLANLALLCFSLMVISGTWIVFSIFRKNGIALGILLGLGGWFTLCSILVSLIAMPNSNLEWLKYFKYFTIQSLFNSPLQFGKPEKPLEGTGTVLAKLLPIKVADFAWQLPLMFMVSVGFFTGGQLIIKNKDFAF